MLNITLMVYLGDTRFQAIKRWLFWGSAFVLFVPPTVILTVMGSIGKLGYAAGTPLCSFKSEEVAGLSNGWSAFFLMFPFTTFAAIGFSLMLLVILRLYFMGSWPLILQQWRVITFDALFGSNVVVTISGLWLFNLRQTETEEGAMEYYQCLTIRDLASLTPMMASLGLSDPSSVPRDCSADGLLPSWFLFYYAQALTGIISVGILLIFFGRESFLAFWHQWIRPLGGQSPSKTNSRASKGTKGVRVTNSSRPSKSTSATSQSRSVEA
jgi:hypothetical protein